MANSDQSWLFVGISHPTKKIPIPKVKNPEKNPESRGLKSRRFLIDPGDFEEIPGIKITRLKKTPESRG